MQDSPRNVIGRMRRSTQRFVQNAAPLGQQHWLVTKTV